MNELGFESKASVSLTRQRGVESSVSPQGHFTVEHIRDGEILQTYKFPNGVTNVGKDNILEVAFHSGTQITAWHVGLINLASFTALAAADVMNSHTGWIYFTSYTESTRVAWAADAAASQAISNSTPATFNINATGTVKGVFLTSDNTKSGTSGTLWATALFTADVAVVNTDQLKVTYTVSAA